jgi:hypothetical protein
VAKLAAKSQRLREVIGLVGDDREKKGCESRPEDENKKFGPVGADVQVEDGKLGKFDYSGFPPALVLIPHAPGQEYKTGHEKDRKDEKQKDAQIS